MKCIFKMAVCVLTLMTINSYAEVISTPSIERLAFIKLADCAPMWLNPSDMESLDSYYSWERHDCSINGLNVFGTKTLLPLGTVGKLAQDVQILKRSTQREWESNLGSLKKGTKVRILSVKGTYGNHTAILVETLD